MKRVIVFCTNYTELILLLNIQYNLHKSKCVRNKCTIHNSILYRGYKKKLGIYTTKIERMWFNIICTWRWWSGIRTLISKPDTQQINPDYI